jgi:hypothetical protein
MKHYHVLNLGAGVQSTALTLLAMQGRLIGEDGAPIKFDCAIFADTQEEPVDPGHSVYAHLEWIRGQVDFPIHSQSTGRLGDDLVSGVDGLGKRVACIPAFTQNSTGKIGKVQRQCTADYKITPIKKAIRRRLLGLDKGKRVPNDVMVHHYIGISLDESGRMIKAKKRQAENPIWWETYHYPLIQQLQWTRGDCRRFLEPLVPHRVPRSACVFCPFHDNDEWKSIKARGGQDWARAVEVDRALRVNGNVVNRNMDQQMFLHRSCVPLEDIDFDSKPAMAQDDLPMAGECEGMCGH